MSEVRCPKSEEQGLGAGGWGLGAGSKALTSAVVGQLDVAAGLSRQHVLNHGLDQPRSAPAHRGGELSMEHLRGFGA